MGDAMYPSNTFLPPQELIRGVHHFEGGSVGGSAKKRSFHAGTSLRAVRLRPRKSPPGLTPMPHSTGSLTVLRQREAPPRLPLHTLLWVPGEVSPRQPKRISMALNVAVQMDPIDRIN